MTTKDSLFSKPLGNVEGFSFDQAVVDVFPDMLQRSVPGYESIVTQSALLASRFAQPNTRLYDLGSSLGATSLAMRDALVSLKPERTEGCEIHAVDNSPEMIAQCRKVIDLSNESLQMSPNQFRQQPDVSCGSETSANNRNPVIPIHLHEDNLEAHAIENASVVAMNFTLQFVAPEARARLMQSIANALRPGGVLILSEKVCFSNDVVNDLHIDMYHNFKRLNGYSDMEVSQKRTALENVLVPDTLETHQQRLQEAGFSHSAVWFQYFNFASLIAIKN